MEKHCWQYVCLQASKLLLHVQGFLSHSTWENVCLQVFFPLEQLKPSSWSLPKWFCPSTAIAFPTLHHNHYPMHSGYTGYLTCTTSTQSMEDLFYLNKTFNKPLLETVALKLKTMQWIVLLNDMKMTVSLQKFLIPAYWANMLKKLTFHFIASITYYGKLISVFW